LSASQGKRENLADGKRENLQHKKTSVSVYVVYKTQMKTFYVITKRIERHPISNAGQCKTPCWHNAHNVTADELLN
jgi:hypothetical protein